MNAASAIGRARASKRDGCASAGPAGDDRAILLRLRAGDEAAYESLVRSCGARMLATARRMLGDEDDARNVVQDAFLSAFRSIARFEGDCLLSTWLHRIVVNAALMKLRSRRRRPEICIEDLLPAFDGDGHRDVPEIADDEACDVDEQLDRARMRERVRACIDMLPASYRTVLVLRDIEELSTEEVAEMLAISRPNVKTRLHRARQALKTLLERDLGPA
ncbi:MAG TPA: sigma-70 family RNA polymerase sigma factor [Candidatus Binatia bacterium]|nr:sigma-70 family RNA polymerase sigma factor [Candidatus Binatia bacterium]